MTETSGPAPRGAGSGAARARVGDAGDHSAVFAAFARCLADVAAERSALRAARARLSRRRR